MKNSTFTFLGILFCLAFYSINSFAGDDEKKPEGEIIFTKNKCNECHTVTTVGIGKSDEISADEEDETDSEGEKAIEPPDLSNYGNSGMTAEWTNLFLRKKENIDGRKHKKRFKGKKEEREILVNWLLTLKDAEEKNVESK